MPSGLQALLALFLLLPGFISARLTEILTARSQQSDLQRVIQALIHSFVIYFFYVLIFGSGLPVDWTPVVNSAHLSTHIYIWRITVLAVLSILTGTTWGFAKSRDWPLSALRKHEFTERTIRESVWNDVFLTETGTVQVGLGDGRSVIGDLKRYSDNGEEGSLFLSKASWIGESNELIEIPGSGILLTKSADIKFVMFINQSEPEA